MKKNLIIVLAILSSSILLANALYSSTYNAFEPSVSAFSSPEIVPYVPVQLPESVIYDNTDSLIGQINFSASKPFIFHITENCPPSVDYVDTYVDTFSPTNIRIDIKGSQFDKTYTFPPGTYDIYVDNGCPLTHLTIHY